MTTQIEDDVKQATIDAAEHAANYCGELQINIFDPETLDAPDLEHDGFIEVTCRNLTPIAEIYMTELVQDHGYVIDAPMGKDDLAVSKSF